MAITRIVEVGVGMELSPAIEKNKAKKGDKLKRPLNREGLTSDKAPGLALSGVVIDVA